MEITCNVEDELKRKDKFYGDWFTCKSEVELKEKTRSTVIGNYMPYVEDELKEMTCSTVIGNYMPKLRMRKRCIVTLV